MVSQFDNYLSELYSFIILDEFETDELTETLMNLDLDDPDLFSKLPRGYQEEFKKALQEGRLSDLVAMWKPWWYLPHDVVSYITLYERSVPLYF